MGNLLLRPRESRHLRVISSDGDAGRGVTWAQDVCGNAAAVASFQTLSDNLVIDSVAELQHNATAWSIFDVAASSVYYPSDIPRSDALTSLRSRAAFIG